jgi:hypothetical protein
VVIIVRIMRLDVGTPPSGLGFPAFSAQTIGTEALVFITLHAPVLFVAFSSFFFKKDYQSPAWVSLRFNTMIPLRDITQVWKKAFCVCSVEGIAPSPP